MADDKTRSNKWSDQDFARIVEICKASYTISEAAATVAQRFKRPMDGESLSRLFVRRGLERPTTLLREDPVARALKQEEENRLRREHSELLERLREAEKRQIVLDRFARTEIYKIKRLEVASGLREGTAVALASDWHVEEKVPKRADTNGNFYDLGVAEKRVAKFFAGLRWLIDHQREVFSIRNLLLWLGGDLITGYLRAENLEENELSPVEALVWLQQRLVDGIKQLLEDTQLEHIIIPCSHGNHGRTTEKKRVATSAKNSYEWLLYQWLAGYFAQEKRITFITDQSNHQYVQVYDYMLHFHHGDEINYQGGVGGITIPMKKAVFGWDEVKKAHFHHFGHFHQYLDLGNILVNGSLIGYNAYAMSIRATPEPPQQAFYILDSKRGKTAKYPIWVGD